MFDLSNAALGVLALFCVVTAVAPAQAGAEVRMVTTTADSNDGNCSPSDCSLREAIAAADPGDRIEFSTLFDSPQVIVLNRTELVIGESLTLRGPGANLLTVSAMSSSRVFKLGSGIDILMSGLTISDGNAFPEVAGGGIWSEANLVLQDSVVRNSTAVNGGGIATVAGTLAVVRSTIAHNTAVQVGGGIGHFADTALSLTDSTISDNGSFIRGGGLYFVNAGTVSINRSTITANFTVGGNGAGVHRRGGSVSIASSVVAGNFGLAEPSPDVFSENTAGFVSAGFNLIGNAGAMSGVFNAVGDQAGSPTSHIDPRLGPLMLGGGTTPTHRPLGGSPAIDKGNATVGALDQRGQGRGFDTPGVPAAGGGDGSDIGAVEMHSLVVSNDGDTGAGSLREAISQANANGSSLEDVIFDRDFFATSRTIQLATALPNIISPMTLSGPGADSLHVRRNATAEFGIFTNVEPVFGISMSGLTIANGQAPVNGGGIHSRSDLTLSHVVVKGNRALVGGGVAVIDGNATIANSTFNDNLAGSGGGIFFHAESARRTMRLSESTVSGNFADGLNGLVGEGAGVLSLGFRPTVEIAGSTVSNNAGLIGGGVMTVTNNANDVARTFFHNSVVANNVASAGPNVARRGQGLELVTSRGYNLSNDASIDVFVAATDVLFRNVGLAPLASNGAATPTHALLPGNPGIDKGQTTAVRYDQRGRPRPYDNPAIGNSVNGDGRDIGAFEVHPEELFSNGFE